ncbi:uncharacterized protein BJ171DRAFT_600009 [Polychytrium aggregatum]|uniref:uncharacterized protein n=1 Tax=Polychytrium aggregatum TaxID=110093 RepID=UPI0022FEDE07|nr:uncharacterized protein BJ171DRAFT_600009 [Polychytrium aggregatum]KAI9203446.1 hypothetical protein BJ171DRAFT_600009 [Polychytrium aggregatum]
MSFEEFRSRKIRVFRNGDIFAPGKKVVISTRFYRNFEQFLHALSNELLLVNGAVRKIFTMEGQPVSSLDDVHENGSYVASGGESFKNLMLTLNDIVRLKSNVFVQKIFDAETGVRIRSLDKLHDGQNIVVASHEKLKKGSYRLRKADSTEPKAAEKKADEEPYRNISCYPNGDIYHNGWTVIIRKSRFQTLKKLIDHLNSQIELINGSVKSIYSLEGAKIQSIDEIAHGHEYVLAGDDPFIKAAYNCNSYKPHQSGEPRGLAGATTHNDFMDKIRKIQKSKAKPPHQRRVTEGAAAEPHPSENPVEPKVHSAKPAKKVVRVSSKMEVVSPKQMRKSQGTVSNGSKSQVAAVVDEDVTLKSSQVAGSDSNAVYESEHVSKFVAKNKSDDGGPGPVKKTKSAVSVKTESLSYESLPPLPATAGSLNGPATASL